TIMISNEVYKELKDAKKGELAPGDFVRMRNSGTNGVVESISKNKAFIQVGQLRMTVNLRDIEQAREPLDLQSTKSVQADTVAVNAGFDGKLDIRGVKPEEALKMVEDFMDRALMTSSSQVRIVHGKGTGALRNAVRHKLREYREIKSAYHPEEKEGGDGVTLVDF
ncbi:MAG: Smr/MutS family protein, partial [Bacteroidota bacterium]